MAADVIVFVMPDVLVSILIVALVLVNWLQWRERRRFRKFAQQLLRSQNAGQQ